MLAFPGSLRFRRLGEVESALREAAGRRDGDWEVQLGAPEGWLSWRTKAEAAAIEQSVRFTEAEFCRLNHLVRHAMANGTKLTVLRANLEQAGQTLWPTGSTDHIAMRVLGPHAVMSWVMTDVGSIATCWGCFSERYRARLKRLPSKVTVADQIMKESATQDVAKDVGEHGGITPVDAEIIATEGNRLVEKGGVHYIVGQEFGQDQTDMKTIVGAKIGPLIGPPNVYAPSTNNLVSAKVKRLDEKQVPYTGTKIDRARIGGMVRASMIGKKDFALFSKSRIQKWAEEKFHMTELKSGKWSDKRLDDSMKNLITQAYPEIKLKANVKMEPMPEGKAPRMLIADGDDGQLMALVVVKCFEDLLFEWFEDRSIKHVPKQEGVARCIQQLRRPQGGAKLVEGDGTAWDTTCNAKIREQVENPVLRHIMEVLIQYGVVPEQWHQEHLAVNEKKKFKTFFTSKWKGDGKGQSMVLKFDAIRRSGHRGTSCLNWWINFVLWVCGLFACPEEFLHPGKRNAKDLEGNMRWWNGCFEGDDSLCAIHPELAPGTSMQEKFLEWWVRQGFRMKLVHVDNAATFVGMIIACEDGEPTDAFIPDLPRAFRNMGVSVSPTIGRAYRGEVSEKEVRDVAAAAYFARAYDFAGKVPSVSRKCLQYAKDIGSLGLDDMKFRTGGDAKDIELTIESRNLAVTDEDELVLLNKMGFSTTPEELEGFKVYPWRWGETDFDSFRSSLPASWRIA